MADAEGLEAAKSALWQVKGVCRAEAKLLWKSYRGQMEQEYGQRLQARLAPLPALCARDGGSAAAAAAQGRACPCSGSSALRSEGWQPGIAWPAHAEGGWPSLRGVCLQANLRHLEGDLAFLRGAGTQMAQLSTHVTAFIAASHAKAHQAAARQQVQHSLRLLLGRSQSAGT